MSPTPRSLLLTFREAHPPRAQAEAEVRRKTARASANAALAQARQSADSQLAEARKALETGQSILAQANLNHLWEQARVALPVPRPGANPSQRLSEKSDPKGFSPD